MKEVMWKKGLSTFAPGIKTAFEIKGKEALLKSPFGYKKYFQYTDYGPS